jgi:hypothetical protein
MNLSDWAEKARKKCNENDKPAPLYWLEHIGHDSDEDWCYECAIALMKYFNGENERPATIWDSEEIPDWTPAPGSVSIDGGWCSESDSTRFCARCGCRLEFGPTDHYLESELKHFEGCAPNNDWYSFWFLLDALDGYETVNPDWYSRALKLAERYLGSDTMNTPQLWQRRGGWAGRVKDGETWFSICRMDTKQQTLDELGRMTGKKYDEYEVIDAPESVLEPRSVWQRRLW